MNCRKEDEGKKGRVRERDFEKRGAEVSVTSKREERQAEGKQWSLLGDGERDRIQDQGKWRYRSGGRGGDDGRPGSQRCGAGANHTPVL